MSLVTRTRVTRLVYTHCSVKEPAVPITKGHKDLALCVVAATLEYRWFSWHADDLWHGFVSKLTSDPSPLQREMHTPLKL